MRFLALMAMAPLVGCATLSHSVGPLSGGLVHTFRQGIAGDQSNVCWFETPNGTVLVDVPLTDVEANRLKGDTVSTYLIYITEGRAERFGSLDLMRGSGKAQTTPAVASEIERYGDKRLAVLKAKFSTNIASHVNPPTPAIEERHPEMLAGELEVELLPLGPSRSESSLAIYLPKTGELITGDVVMAKEHYDLTWGRSAAWRKRIRELQAIRAKSVYPGHGAPGGPELLDQAQAYLKYFHDAVADKVKSGKPAHIAAADLMAIKKQLVQHYPNYDRQDRLDVSIAGEYAMQLQHLGKKNEGETDQLDGEPAAETAPSPERE